MQDAAMAEAIALVCFANAVFLVVCGLVRREFVVSWNGLTAMFSLASCIDLIQIVLVFWLLREMPPVRFATRYLVIPLLTIVGGYVFLRPELTVRMVVGMGLLIGGSAWALFSKTPDDDAILSLR
jgi:drug/metabolite transporter (DMT)-like permease